MKILKLESIGGASGDMILGALIPLGIDIDKLNSQLASLLPDEKFKVLVDEVVENGISGIQAKVEIAKKEHHHHRGFTTIKEIIEKSELPEAVKTKSIEVFKALGTVEAKIHDSTLDKIHFHEVGAVDSIVDIVGACLAFHELGIDTISIESLPLGSGTTKCSHGVIPVPVPATVALLKGFPVTQTDEPFELVTPTGAALITSFENSKVTGTYSIIDSVYSYGQRKLNNRPNLLRALLIETEAEAEETDNCIVMETNIDDMSPEILASTVEQLMEQGALDVWTTPIQMKKQRSGVMLSVLCNPEDSSKLRGIIFTETSSFGIREYEVTRNKLKRHFTEVETPYGTVKVKVGSLNGKEVTHSPEFSNCEKLAKANNVPVKKVYDETLKKV